MKTIDFSFIIPVYNRPDELEKLLLSISLLEYQDDFEVVVIEDGSSLKCDAICERFRESVTVSYYFKSNSGPGDSRNYGMSRALGNYFVILDSDCILPKDYLKNAKKALLNNYVDCYGGPDAAHESFTDLQKAINYSMTSFFTTGGIRGGNENIDKFQPRSFNMGLSKRAFEKTGGFGKIHPGEDPDLTIRLWNDGFKTALFKEVYVYHERRISWSLFYKQVHKFGMVRVILNKWHPQTARVIYWLPSLFLFFILFAFVMLAAGVLLPIVLLFSYLLVVFIHSTLRNGMRIGLMSLRAVLTQFIGYGYGFLKSVYYLTLLKRNERKQFPNLFFE